MSTNWTPRSIALCAFVTVLGTLGACASQQDPDRAASPQDSLSNSNVHAVPRSYCLADKSGVRVYVWDKTDWQPSLVYMGDVGAGNPAYCPLG